MPTARLVPLTAALVLSDFSALLAPHGPPHHHPARATSVAQAKIPTPLETVAIRAGRTFLDPPTTDTELYLAVVDSCFDPAARTFDQHVAYVGSLRRGKKSSAEAAAAATAAAAAAGAAGVGAGGSSPNALRRRSLPAAAAAVGEEEEQPAVRRDEDDSRPGAQSGGLRWTGQAPLPPQEEDDAPAARHRRPPTDDGGGDGSATPNAFAAGPSTAGPAAELSGLRRFDVDPGPLPHRPVVAQADDPESAARSEPENPPSAAATSSGATASGAMISAAASPRRKYPVRQALVEAHYKPSTQVLRLRIQTLGFRHITNISLTGPSATLPTGRRLARRSEGDGSGVQWLATAGHPPAAKLMPIRDGDDGASWRAETNHRAASADAFEGDGLASGSSAGDGHLHAPPPLRSVPPGRSIVDHPTVRDAFWHEAKLTDEEAVSLFLGELRLDIYSTARPRSPSRGFLACAQPGARCTPPPALAGAGGVEPAVFRPDSCDPYNELPGWLRKYTRNRLR